MIKIVWTDPVDETHARLGIVIFVILAIAASAGRSLWFFFRHGVRPIAPPRDFRERLWHWAFIAVAAAITLICSVRLLAPKYTYLLMPIPGGNIYLIFGLGIFLTILGFGMMLAAQSQMGGSWRIGIPKDKLELVTLGIYRYTRNPIYSGFQIGMAGFGCLFPSVATLIVYVATVLVLLEWVAREEKHQVEMHGDAFREYCKRTGRFFPRFK
ncbi:MAG: methyltransferase family protein [Planctomycetota bacterium]